MLTIDPVNTRLAIEPDLSQDGSGRKRIALEEMEHLFLNMLFKEMRKSVPEGGIFPQSAAKKIFDEMLDDVLSGEMAKSGQLGVASLMGKQLDLQEASIGLRGNLHSEQARVLAEGQVKQSAVFAE